MESTEVLIPFLEAEGFDVRVEGDTAVYADADYMRGVDLVVQVNTMTTIEKAELEGLIDAVKAGTGLAGWHRRQLPQRGRLPAPDRRPVRLHAGIEPSLRTGEQSDNYLTYTIELTDLARTHPILEGIDDFELTTEQYWVLNDEYNDVLTTTTQEVRPWTPGTVTSRRRPSGQGSGGRAASSSRRPATNCGIPTRSSTTSQEVDPCSTWALLPEQPRHLLRAGRAGQRRLVPLAASTHGRDRAAGAEPDRRRRRHPRHGAAHACLRSDLDGDHVVRGLGHEGAAVRGVRNRRDDRGRRSEHARRRHQRRHRGRARVHRGAAAGRADGTLGYHVLEVMEAIAAAAGERRTVEIESTCERPEPVALN
ncbi:hypothetical protein BW733_08680 [Tessaracoccus flavescens]|uniref:ThuA-like domain-containing protein n=1 Tax=Tessaracoccus flavescens TaxID=399497 RepID=A0A1Q2CXN6_9ACTN|nr:hypothetical protein BW733_08680 [Tessaracoccus flavescens]